MHIGMLPHMSEKPRSEERKGCGRCGRTTACLKQKIASRVLQLVGFVLALTIGVWLPWVGIEGGHIHGMYEFTSHLTSHKSSVLVLVLFFFDFPAPGDWLCSHESQHSACQQGKGCI